jgi:hypothetical protein
MYAVAYWSLRGFHKGSSYSPPVLVSLDCARTTNKFAQPSITIINTPNPLCLNAFPIFPLSEESHHRSSSYVAKVVGGTG